MMKLMIGARRSGKTRALLEYCANNRKRVIVCPNHRVKDFLITVARDLNLCIIRPITVREYKSLVLDNPNPVFLTAIKEDSTPLALTHIATSEIFEGEYCFEELSECLRTLGINIDVATGTIPTIHPQTYLMSNHLPSLSPEHDLGMWDFNKEDK